MLDLVNDILTKAGISASLVTPKTLNMLEGKGAYVLGITITAPISLRLRQQAETNIAAGTYYYIGSANGPGGMKARLKRHFSTTKKPHWHIDHLTLAAARISALAVPHGNECDLGQQLAASTLFKHILPGFGSSDCRTCKSHLLVSMKR